MEHRVTTAQLQILIEYLETHNTLVKGLHIGFRSKEKVEQLWEELKEKLNSVNGATKSTYRWRKYWSDLKTKTKMKAASLRREMTGTGGGPATLLELSPIEEKILDLLGERTIYGDTELAVPIMPVSQSVASPENTNCASGIPEFEDNSDLLDANPPSTSQASAIIQSPILMPTVTTEPQRKRRQISPRQQISPKRRRILFEAGNKKSDSDNFKSQMLRIEEQRVRIEARNADTTARIAKAIETQSLAFAAIAEGIKAQNEGINELISIFKNQNK